MHSHNYDQDTAIYCRTTSIGCLANQVTSVQTVELHHKMLLLLFAMIRSVVKSFKVPDVEVAAARMINESALTRMTDSTPKKPWSDLTPICQMNYLLLGGSTTCKRESSPEDLWRNPVRSIRAFSYLDNGNLD